jgi:hypothetical protein
MISQAFAKKKEAEQEKMADYFGYFRFTIGQKRIYFVAFVGFLMYENGDIDRAYKYIKRSLEDAFFVMRAYEPTKYRRCCPL